MCLLVETGLYSVRIEEHVCALVDILRDVSVSRLCLQARPGLNVQPTNLHERAIFVLHCPKLWIREKMRKVADNQATADRFGRQSPGFPSTRRPQAERAF